MGDPNTGEWTPRVASLLPGVNPHAWSLLPGVNPQWHIRSVQNQKSDRLIKLKNIFSTKWDENSLTRPILNVEKNYRGFKIPGQKDDGVSRHFTSKIEQIRIVLVVC